MAFPLNVPVASAVRTPVGRGVKGTLKDTRPEDMAATALKQAVARVEGLEPKQVEDVVLGCAMPEGAQGLNLARNVIFRAGWPDEVAAETINRYCSSGLQAIVHGALSIQASLNDVVVAGGVETMSMVPMGGHTVSLNPSLVDERPEAYIAMGLTAERVAKRFEVSRQEQDAFAHRSQEKAAQALRDGLFEAELVPIEARVFQNGGVTSTSFSVDECPRTDTTLEGLGKLKPAFTKGGTVTAGNSSPLSDGAAAAVLMSERKLAELGTQPLGRLRGFVTAGVPPDIMGIGPVPAIRKLLSQCELTLKDIDLFEINEAFAAQAAYCQRELGIADDRLNVSGGAIALGHPLGCTGAKLTATLLYGLRRRSGRYGIVSMCVGGGMGAAGLYEIG